VAWAIWQRSVSHPRSSNRTCEFPASGFPTGFVVRLTAVIQRQKFEVSINHFRGEPLRSAVWYLMSPLEEASDAFANQMIDGFVGPASRSIAEVPGPAGQ